MVATQHAFHNVDVHFSTGLHDNLSDALPHRPFQNLVTIFCGPHDVKPVVKSRVSGFQSSGEKIRDRFAEADRLEAGGLNPLGGK